MDAEEDLRGFNLLFFVTEVVGLVAVILVAVWTGQYRGGFAWSASPALQFNWHPLLMTIGMIYLFANSFGIEAVSSLAICCAAILIYRAVRSLPKKSVMQIHSAIHVVVIVLTAVALYAVVDFHNRSQTPNFYSLHSWLGFITVVIYVVQWLFGFAAFLYPGFPTSVRAAIMPIHTFMGLMAFILAIATACTGLTEKAIFSVEGYELFGTETYLVNMVGVLLLLFGAMIVYLSTESKYAHVTSLPASSPTARTNTSFDFSLQ